jgi:hypothetical protein
MTSLVAVLLVTSVTMADVIQTENYLAGLGNAVTLVMCQTDATSANNLILDNTQCAVGTCGVTASEYQMGIFRQAAGASGTCTAIGLLQEVASGGIQNQNIGNGVGPKGQTEASALTATQTLTKANGEGTGTASQLAALSTGQTAANCAGTVSQSSAVVNCQDAYVHGIPGATLAAGSTTQVSTSQTQIVN